MDEELSVHDLSAARDDAATVTVSGAGSPDGATVSVEVSINGGGVGTGSATVQDGQWSVAVAVASTVGSTGTVTAKAIEPQNFPDMAAFAFLKFIL